MSRTNSIMWDMFTSTGNIDIYVKYKQHTRHKEEFKCQKTPSKQTQ